MIRKSPDTNDEQIKRCVNCHSEIPPEDKYCRICGTSADEGIIEPRERGMMQCIYGPMPQKRTHTCEKCGCTWTTYLMFDGEKFCPECGGNAPAKEQQ